MGTSNHLDLLRGEYLDLQERYAQLQQQYAILQARVEPDGSPDTGCFAGQLFDTMRNLFEHHSFSDITIRLGENELKCHKFLLTTRSYYWNDLENRDFIEISGVTLEAFHVVYRWLYTDSLPRSASQFETRLLQEVCQVAFRFHFGALQSRCVQLLKTRVDVENCVSLFEFADMEDIAELRDYCSAVVAAHWKDFKPEKFAQLSAVSLLRLLKKNSLHVLHSIIQLNREDVLLLYFIENDGKISNVVNTVDEQGLSPLELSLVCGRINIASQLLQKNASCNAVDQSGYSILMRMIDKGDAVACEFLAKAGADLNFVHAKTGSTILHRIACANMNRSAMAQWINSWLERIDLDSVDIQGRTALLQCVIYGNTELAKFLLRSGADVIKADNEGKTALFITLFDRCDLDLSEEIVKYGGDPVVNHMVHGDSLLHISVRKDNCEATRFLLEHQASVDVGNNENITPLEIAVKQNNLAIVNLLLDYNASVKLSRSNDDSLLHEVISKGTEMLNVFAVKCKDINWSFSDALSYALNTKALDCAKIIVSVGGQVEEKDSYGNSLLIQRILLSDDAGASFLLELGADHSAKDSKERTCLELAALHGLINTLRIICGLGVNINERSDRGSGYTVLVHTLSEGHYDCAALLVSLGCDLESVTLDGSYVQTMLHHFIDVVDEQAAVFLIESGCDGDAARVPRDSNNSIKETPIHRAVSAQMNKAVAALVTSKANLSVQDSQGRTACHIAVQERNHDALSELLKANDVGFLSIRDKFGHTPFSQALFSKQHMLATAMINRQPHVALQTNANGENLLHISVKSNDLESVLFLLSNSNDAARAVDGTGRNAIHYAADVDNELILRNLLLVGCDVNVTANDGSTALHVAVRGNRPHHTEILLENGADANQVDGRHENALLIAVRHGSLDCVKVLLSHSSVDGLAVNKNGQSALHLCAVLTTEKTQSRTSSIEMCEILLRREAQSLPEKIFSAYVDLRDVDGNTALMLAYMVGNGDVCRCLLRYGATMGARNADGATIFTYETPTRLLLFRLLDSLEREPRWSDGDVCDCGVRFSITVRKHHCRHCGRLVCAKCSEVTMPIAKFGEEKRVRVCSLCVEVLTKGVR
ncbi:hypothetical protein KIN20_002218 [Parelaphostrongylus tenuis]|uniref:Ankyrin repeat and FYVE domain-containing protein 1 n=1 Tax=Parelaphostrongylus tenuis TaxID=148309 RepID=A0AAD5LXD9_PARTN|nr:hypothetical protein KIN20_002218 [Parelaphostrongylus tenuis]